MPSIQRELPGWFEMSAHAAVMQINLGLAHAPDRHAGIRVASRMTPTPRASSSPLITRSAISSVMPSLNLRPMRYRLDNPRQLAQAHYFPARQVRGQPSRHLPVNGNR